MSGRMTGLILRDNTLALEGPVWEAYKYLTLQRFGERRPPIPTPLIEGFRGNRAPLTDPNQGSTRLNAPMQTTTRGLRRGMTTVWLSPAPETLNSSLSADGQEQPILYSPRPASYSRKSGSYSLSMQFAPDRILTPQMMGTPIVGASGEAIPDWISYYLMFLETLTLPISGLGRKPWLALQHGNELWGVGQFALQLEGMDTDRVWYHRGYLDRAEVTLRFREYLVV